MKLTNVSAQLATMKSHAVKALAVAALAGAALAAVPAAQAQRFVVGVNVGGPRYFAPAPPVVVYGPAFYGGYGYRHDDWRFRHDHRDWRR